MTVSEDIIPVEAAGTLAGLFRERVRRTPEQIAYKHYDTATQAWLDTRWREMAERVSRCQAGLAGENLHKGDRIGILLRNSREWIQFDQAALGLGLVVVPLYMDDRPDNMAYILRHAAVKLLVLQGNRQWRGLKEALGDDTPLERVIICAPADRDDIDLVARHIDDWLPGRGGALAEQDSKPDALATIVYTSGTTGPPKGVMLSHHNILSISHSVMLRYAIYQDDLFLSFLPLSHMLERTGGYYLPMMAGATVAHARSIPLLGEDLKSLNPSILIAVPRIFERVYCRIQQQLLKKPLPARWLFRLSIRVGWHRFNCQQGRRRWGPELLLWPLCKRLVADKITANLGTRLRIAISGGAALPIDVGKALIGLGVNILQGYGLTEASPVISSNPDESNDPASIGFPFDKVEVRIGDNDELLARSPGVMLGYWNNHAATAKTIDSDGWLHTGDQARIDDDGRIYITGRIKDILVLSNGEKVPPGDMENSLTMDPLIEQALVLGEAQPFLAAILVLEKDAWIKLANSFMLDPYKPENLGDERVRRAILKKIPGLLHNFPGYAKVRRVILTLEPWTVENGLMTPTMKVKRQKVLETFIDEVVELYECA